MPRVARGRELSPGSPLAGLPGIGPVRARALADAGLATVLDLLLELPFRREDRARFASVADLVPGGPPLTVAGTVAAARLVRTRRHGFSIFEATLEDGSGSVGLIFYNQPWLARWMSPGSTGVRARTGRDETAGRPRVAPRGGGARRRGRRRALRRTRRPDLPLAPGTAAARPPKARRAGPSTRRAPLLPERLAARPRPRAGAAVPRGLPAGGALPRERGRGPRTRQLWEDRTSPHLRTARLRGAPRVPGRARASGGASAGGAPRPESRRTPRCDAGWRRSFRSR